MPENMDLRTVEGFGEEWTRFNQSALGQDESTSIFEAYFRLFPWRLLPADGGVGADIGSGSGRWAKHIAPKVKKLYCVDPSESALSVARQNLRLANNVEFLHASADRIPVEDTSLDFAYSLGVLHHLPDLESALKRIHQKLRPGAPLLLYLYYAFDNRPRWYRWLWKASDAIRRVVARLPSRLRFLVADVLAVGVYLPLATAAYWGERAGFDVSTWPLSAYRNFSFYTMRTDALDRFGTRLEKRFTQAQIRRALENAGFRTISFSDEVPFWTSIAYKA